MSIIIIRNIEDTADDKSPLGGSWIEYWEEKQNKKTDKCCNINCDNIATDGSHICINSLALGNNKIFIIPFCHSCNEKSIDLDIEIVSINDLVEIKE
jgi:hypothetical protein